MPEEKKEMQAGRCIDCKFSDIEEERRPTYPYDDKIYFLRCRLTKKRIRIDGCPYFY